MRALELPLTLRKGDVVQEVLAFAQRHGADGVVTSAPVAPRVNRYATRINRELPLWILDGDPFVELPRTPAWAVSAAIGVRQSQWFGRASGGSWRRVLQHLLFIAAQLAGVRPEVSGPKRREFLDHHLIGLLGRLTPLEGGLRRTVLQRASVSLRNWRITSPLLTTSKNSSRLANPELKGALPLPLNRRAGSAFQSVWQTPAWRVSVSSQTCTP